MSTNIVNFRKKVTTLATVAVTTLFVGLGMNPALASPTPTATSSTPTATNSPSSSATPSSNSSSSSTSSATNSPSSSASATNTTTSSPSSSSSSDSKTVAKPKAQAAAAAAANTKTISNITLTNTVLWDGTGQGTSDACYINSANGYAVGDNNANDGVVCTQDTIGYQVTIAVAASSTPTVLNILYDSEYGGYTSDICANDPNGAYTATPTNFSNNNSVNESCQYTFPANTSVTFNKTITGKIENYIKNSNNTTSLKAFFNVNDSNTNPSSNTDNEVDSSSTTIVSQYTVDTSLRGGDTLTTVQQNGQTYAQYSYDVNSSNTGMPAGYNKDKGTYSGGGGYPYSNYLDNISLNMGNFPSDTIFNLVYKIPNNPNNTLTVNGFNISGVVQGVPQYINNQNQSNYYSTMVTVNALIPINTLESLGDTNFTANLVRADVTPGPADEYGHSDNVYYSNNYNSVPEPGLGQPITYDTAGVNGPGTQTGYKVPNNDWINTTFQGKPTDQIFSKNIYENNFNNLPSQNLANNNNYRPNTKLWDGLGVNSYPYIANNGFSMCDAWSNTNNGVQFIDTDRTPYVYDYSTQSNYSGSYHFEYKNDPSIIFVETGPDSIDGSTSCNDNTGWSTTPNANTNIVKVVFDGPVDFTNNTNGSQRFMIYVPIKTGDVSSYPNYPASTRIFDEAFYSLDNSNPNYLSGWYLSKSFNILGPTFSGNNSVNYNNTTMTAGNDYNVYSSQHISYLSLLDTDNHNLNLTQTIQLPSCAYNIGEAQAPSNQNVTWSNEQIIPGDNGPDGIPCTADDIKGPTVVLTGQGTIYSGNTSGSQDFPAFIPFSVYNYAKSGTPMPITSEGKAYDNKTNQLLVDSTTSSNGTVIGSTVLGQSKSVDTTKAKVGDTIGWKLLFFNNTNTALNNVEFIDVLPYNGDNRGTVLQSPLTNISIDSSNATGATIYVTTDPSNSISADTSDPTNDPSNSSRWCLYGSSSCPAGGNYTAVYIVYNTMNSAEMDNIHITASTVGEANTNVAYNNLGIGTAPGVSLPIAATNNVKTYLYIPSMGMSVNKTVDKVGANIGSTLNYTITATNTGTVDFTPTVNDPNCINLSLTNGDLNNDGLLNAANTGAGTNAETWTWSCTHTLVQGDLDSGAFTNTVTITGTPNSDTGLTPLTQSASAVTTVAVNGTISGTVYIDNNVNYNYDSDTDTIASPPSWETDSATLYDSNNNIIAQALISSDGTYTFTNIPTGNYYVQLTPYVPNYIWGQWQILQAGTNHNTSGPNNPANSQVFSLNGNNQVIDFGLFQSDTLNVNKAVDKPGAISGDTLTYTIQATINGTRPYRPSIVDPGCDNTPVYTSGDDDNNGLIDPNETWTWTCTHLLNDTDMQSGSYVNTATVVAHNENTNIPDLTSSASATTVPPQAQVNINKQINDDWTSQSSPGTLVSVNSTMGISYEINNWGNIPLYNINIQDSDTNTTKPTCYYYTGGGSFAPNASPRAGGGGLNLSPYEGAPLQPGENLKCFATVKAPELGVQYTDTATVTTTVENKYQSYIDTNSLTAQSTAYAHTIPVTFTKTVDKTSNVNVGDTLNYTITLVDNYGDPTNPDQTSIWDNTCDNFNLVSGDDNGDGMIAPGETWVWTCTHTVTQDDIDAGSYQNVASGNLYISSTGENVNLTATAITNTSAIVNSNIQINTCYNTSDCATPATNTSTILDATTQTTDNTGSTIYNNLTPGSNHDLVVNPPAGMQVSDVLVDGVSVGTTVPTSVAAPDSGTRVITIVYVPATVSVPTSSADNPVFDSGI